jgi:hypothetical protein
MIAKEAFRKIAGRQPMQHFYVILPFSIAHSQAGKRLHGGKRPTRIIVQCEQLSVVRVCLDTAIFEEPKTWFESSSPVFQYRPHFEMFSI